MKICYQNNRKGAATEQKDAKINCRFQEQYYKNANAGKKKFQCSTDYQKVFDRVPHSWIIKFLELLGINNTVIAFTKKVMTYRRICMGLHAEDELIQTEDMKIECGIFQGDSLSAHLFCICLFPLNEL